MSHTFHQLYYHFVWGTHSREPLIDRRWRPQLLEILNDEAKKRGGLPIRHNAMPDHAHLLVRLPPAISPAEFIGPVKGATSFRMNRELTPKFKLSWQEGYGVLSLRRDELITVARYIDRQEEHHRTGKLSALLESAETENDNWIGEELAQLDNVLKQLEKPGEPG